jgi:uncharacterized protein YndB with AHSA1/START domain
VTDARFTDVVVERTIAAPPETVFAGWVDPGIAARWLFTTPEGIAVRAETDPVEGGEFLFIEERADERIVHVGEYLTVDPPRRLAFVFSLDQFRTTNQVDICFETAADGGTLLVLTHKLDIQWAAFADRTAKGWALMLDELERVLGEVE